MSFTLQRSLCLGVVTLLALVKQAQADAVPPPLPLQCSKGTTLVHGHDGTHCVPVAPTDCPVGWVGVLGGQCLLDVCTETCGAGLECKPVDLCATEGMGYRYGSNEARGPLLAAPPAPQWMISYSDVCGAKRTCKDGATCIASKVCLPPNVHRPANRPASGGVAQRPGERGATRTDPAPADASGAPVKLTPTATAAPLGSATTIAPPATSVERPQIATVPPPGRGGAGCSSASGSVSLSGLALGSSVALAIARRRRRR